MALTPTIALLLVAATWSLLAAGGASRHHAGAGRHIYFWLMTAAGTWCLLSALRPLVADLTIKVALTELAALPISATPLLWLLMTLTAAGRGLPRWRAIALLAAVPAVTVALAFTNGWHGLMWRQIALIDGLLVVARGPWYPVAAIYSYALILGALAILAQAFSQAAPLFRPWLLLLIGAGQLPWVVNIHYQAGMLGPPGADPTPLTFTVTTLLASWVLRRPQLLDLTPVARSMLIEQMGGGVIVCDRHWHIVDVNRAACRLVGEVPVNLGAALAAALPALSPAIMASAEAGEAQELTPDQIPGAWLEVQTTPLLGRGGRPIGWLALLRDISGRRAAEAAYLDLTRQLRDERDFAFQVMRTMGEGLTVTDATGHYTYVNEAMGRMLGFAPAALIGLRPCDIVCEDDRPIVAAAHAERKRGLAGTYTVRLRRADGQLVSVQIHSVPRSSGAYAGAVAVITDLSERLAVEARLHASQEQLAAANARLTELSRTDPLTGLRNRAAFEERLSEEVARAVRYNLPLALLMIDIDQFKGFNDTFGHVAGDEVLRAVGALFHGESRQNDIVARYGGEEFAVILPSTDAMGALIMAERFRGAVANASWSLRAVTISVGAVAFGAAMSRDELVGSADGALYWAKRHGRNRVALAGAGGRPGVSPRDADRGVAVADGDGDVGRLASLVDLRGYLVPVEGDAQGQPGDVLRDEDPDVGARGGACEVEGDTPLGAAPGVGDVAV